MLTHWVLQQLRASTGGHPETLGHCRSMCFYRHLPSVAGRLVVGALATSLWTILEEVVDEEEHNLKQG